MCLYRNKIILLLLLFQPSSTVKHSLTFLAIISYGIRNLPNLFTTEMDEIQVDYYDSNGNRKQSSALWKNISDSYPSMPFSEDGLTTMNLILRIYLDRLSRLNPDEAIHVLQCMSGCELDEKSVEVVTFHQCGYNGDDFIKLDFKNLSWIVQNPLAASFKPEWDSDPQGLHDTKLFLSLICPQLLNKFVTLSTLQSKDLTTVSLLQKTPSSPVRCFATGFYSITAVLFWTRDGKEIHNNVESGETLPNHDDTYQMSVDLNVSSIASEDWRRYDCVFKLSNNTIITRLEKTAISTNWVSVSPSEFPADLTIGLVVGLLLLSLFLSGLLIWKNVKNASYFPDKSSYPSYPSTTQNVPDNIELQ